LIDTENSRPVREHSDALVSVQVLRGIAALGVVFYHVYVIGKSSSYWNVEVFKHLARPGLYGVNLFFVLSGFIILKAHFKDFGISAQLRPYLYKRFFRIYPVYWFFLVLFIAFGLAGLGDPEMRFNLTDILTFTTLINFTADQVLPLKVAWTLLYEVRYYLFLGLFILNVRLGIIAFALFFTYIIMANYFELKDMFNFYTYWNLHFFSGMAVFFILNRFNPRYFGVAMLLNVVCLGLVFVILNDAKMVVAANSPNLILLAICFGVILFSAIVSENYFARYSPRFLKVLGDASYSIYLVHSAAVSLCFVIAKKLHLIDALPKHLLFLLIFIFATIAGYFAYLFVEKPMTKYFRDIMRGNRGKI
jgi:exopolysaccharide production protein ExoZ